jgi:hypothetical protein
MSTSLAGLKLGTRIDPAISLSPGGRGPVTPGRAGPDPLCHPDPRLFKTNFNFQLNSSRFKI